MPQINLIFRDNNACIVLGGDADGADTRPHAILCDMTFTRDKY